MQLLESSLRHDTTGNTVTTLTRGNKTAVATCTWPSDPRHRFELLPKRQSNPSASRHILNFNRRSRGREHALFRRNHNREVAGFTECIRYPASNSTRLKPTFVCAVRKFRSNAERSLFFPSPLEERHSTVVQIITKYFTWILYLPHQRPMLSRFG